jgi:hypothetical protein
MAEQAGPERLTEALLAPVGVVNPAAWQEAVVGIPEVLAGLAGRRGGGGPCRLTDFHIRRALNPTDDGVDDAPFAWSARTSRRALGLAAVRLLVAGQVRSPAEGVRAAVAQATSWVRREGPPLGGMDQWLGELPPAARAAVAADAVTWATRLWGSVDWDSLDGPPVIGRDHWWDSPHSSLLALRGRADVRAGAAHLVTLSGTRRASVRAELSVVALVEALRSRDGIVPGRVIGWWPDSGHLVRVEVEPTVLAQGVEAVAVALRGGHMRVAA